MGKQRNKRSVLPEASPGAGWDGPDRSRPSPELIEPAAVCVSRKSRARAFVRITNEVIACTPIYAARLVCLLLLAGSLMLVCSLPANASGGAPGKSVAADPNINSPARQLFQLLNKERVNVGLRPLVWDDRLAEAAIQHSRLMSQRKQLSHQFSGEAPLQNRLNAIPLDRSGENVAVGPTVAEAHDGLMHSPPHRANILSPRFDAGGIGIVKAGEHLWVTEDFAHRIEQMSPEAAANQVAKAFMRARAQAGAPRLERTDSARVTALACAMARRNRLDTSKALELPEAHYAVAYTSTDPSELPEGVLRYRPVRDVKRYVVGVCFERTPTYPSGVYWVVMVLFSR